MRLFVERLLIDRVPSDAPEPNRYDEELSVSVTESGAPFVEACANPSLVTLTEAEGEGETQIWMVTRTLTDGEGVDNPALVGWATTFTKTTTEAPDAPVMTVSGAAPWSVTITRADAEAPDRDFGGVFDRAFAHPPARRVTGLWGITKTEAPGEAPDQR